MLPFSGTANWVEPLLFVAAGAVFALYVFQRLLPVLRQSLDTTPDPEERAGELLEQYRDRQTSERDDESPPTGDVP